MLNLLFLSLFNRILAANPITQRRLQPLATHTLELNLPLFSLKFSLLANGLVTASQQQPEASIYISLASTSYLIHKNQAQTLSQLKINGNRTLALEFLQALTTLELTNVIYQSPLPGSTLTSSQGLAAVYLEKILAALQDYSSLVVHNGTHSLSQYLQFELEAIANHFELEQFYTQVDELSQSCDRLTARIERLKQKS